MTVRTSSIPFYSEIARESFDKIVALEPRKRALEADLKNANLLDDKTALEFNLMSIDNELVKLASITIVFATIAIEAHIYDFAARHLSDSFVKKYVDKLDLVSKWVIIPKLITGKELPRGGEWFQLLKNLVRERNSIIHSKTSDAPYTIKEVQKYLEKRNEDQVAFFNKVREAIDLLDTLPVEIGKIDSDEMYWAEINLSKPSKTLEEK